MAIRTISDAGGYWSSASTWVEGQVPTNADDVVATETSGDLVISSAASCKSINLSLYKGAFSQINTLNVWGDINFSGDWECTIAGIFNTYSVGTLISGGKSFYNFRVNGTLTLLDSLTVGRTLSLSVAGLGTLNIGSYSVTANSIVCTSTSKTIVNGDGNIYLVGAGTILNVGTSLNILWNNFTGTWHITNPTDVAKDLQTYSNFYMYNIKIYGGGTGAVSIGTGSFQNIEITGPKTVIFKSSTPYNFDKFIMNSNENNVINLQTNLDTFNATFSKPTGRIICDYLTLRNIVASGGAKWYAGSHSTNIQNSTGWIYDDPPNVSYIVKGKPSSKTIIRSNNNG